MKKYLSALGLVFILITIEPSIVNAQAAGAMWALQERARHEAFDRKLEMERAQFWQGPPSPHNLMNEADWILLWLIAIS